MNNLLTDLTLIGLLADIVGAIFISKSVIFHRNNDIFNASGAAIGFSSEATLDAIIAKREGVFGCVLLVFGFIDQFIGSFNTSALVWDWLLLLSVVTALIVVSVAVSFVIRKWSIKTTNTLVKEYRKKNNS